MCMQIPHKQIRRNSEKSIQRRKLMAEHLLLLPILALAAGNVSGDSALIRKLKKVLLLCREARLRNQRQELLLFLAQVQLSCSRGWHRLGTCPSLALFCPKPPEQQEPELHSRHQDDTRTLIQLPVHMTTFAALSHAAESCWAGFTGDGKSGFLSSPCSPQPLFATLILHLFLPDLLSLFHYKLQTLCWAVATKPISISMSLSLS